MGNLELLELLDKTYSDKIEGVKTYEDLIVAKAHREVVAFVRLQLEPKPKKRRQ